MTKYSPSFAKRQQLGVKNQQQRIKTDKLALDRIIMHLRGLMPSDVRKLARQFISADGAISQSDLPLVSKNKLHMLLIWKVFCITNTAQKTFFSNWRAHAPKNMAQQTSTSFLAPTDNLMHQKVFCCSAYKAAEKPCCQSNRRFVGAAITAS